MSQRNPSRERLDCGRTLHVMGRDRVTFPTETEAVTSFWFDEEALKGDEVGIGEGTITEA